MRKPRVQLWMEKFGLTKEDAEIVEKFNERIPSSDQIVREGWNLVPSEKREKQYVKNHFSESIVGLEKSAHFVYLNYERSAFPHVTEMWIKRNRNLINKLAKQSKNHSDFLNKICQPLCPFFGALHTKASQMRKSRGGKAFEIIVRFLLNYIGVSCEKPSGREQRKILKRIDCVVPDQQTALTTPDKAFFLSCKRTLRERWKQTIPERKPAWRVFLLTIDEELSEDKAKEIDQLGMIAYVRDELKDQNHLRNKGWIRKLSDLPKDLGIV
jgi:4-alpha-glucanotransferase